ncbi:MAG: hypothetical protein EA405_03100 [Rhodospirillales bacterium]|nr:MAG: hypothetical protein EA405_03100 [Rhodospirillales bacterium]
MFLRAGILALCGLVIAGASPGLTQPLEPELQHLLAEHPQIRARQSELVSAEREVERAFAGYLPRVDASGSVGPTHTQTDVRELAGIGPFEEVSQTARLTVTQNVFDGFETPARVKVARLNADIARTALEGTRQGILFDGIAAYVDVLRQEQLVAIARLSEESIRRQAELEDERVIRGAGIAVDVLQAKARLQIAVERRVALEGALQNAITRYIQVFGHPPVVAAMSDPSFPAGVLPDSLHLALTIAEAESPAIISSVLTMQVASERRRLARAGYYPRLEVVGSARVEQDFDLLPGTRRDLSVMLQATWTLFNGFATRAGVAQAAADFEASRNNHDFVMRNVAESTRLAWQQYLTQRQRVDLLDNAVAIAAEAFDARRRLREAGRDTVIDVLIAEDEVNNARINLTDAKYQAEIAAYQILLALGRLDGRILADAD